MHFAGNWHFDFILRVEFKIADFSQQTGCGIAAVDFGVVIKLVVFVELVDGSVNPLLLGVSFEAGRLARLVFGGEGQEIVNGMGPLLHGLWVVLLGDVDDPAVDVLLPQLEVRTQCLVGRQHA